VFSLRKPDKKEEKICFGYYSTTGVFLRKKTATCLAKTASQKEYLVLLMLFFIDAI
jgi:hypothetical protein